MEGINRNLADWLSYFPHMALSEIAAGFWAACPARIQFAGLADFSGTYSTV